MTVMVIAACGAEPTTARPTVAPSVAPAVIEPPVVAAPAVVAPAVAKPATDACATRHVAASWRPPVSASRGLDPADLPRLPRRGLAAFRYARGVLARRCAGKLALPEEDEYDPVTLEDGAIEIGAQPIGTDGLLFRTVYNENGVDAEYGVETVLHDLAACTSTTVYVRYHDMGLSGAVADQPPAAAMATVTGARPYDPSRADHAYATLLATATGTCEPEEAGMEEVEDPTRVPGAPTVAIAGLPFVTQTWFSGRPGAQARVWRPVDEVDEQTGERNGARVVPPPRKPRRLFAAEGVEIFGADLPGRNAGFALAVYETAGDRHRWVMMTRGCLLGSRVYWLAAGAGLVVGYALSDHPAYQEEAQDGLFVLDVAAGRAYRLLLDGSGLAWVDGPEQDTDEEDPPFAPSAAQVGRFRVDAATLRTRCGTIVPLTDIRAAIAARGSLSRSGRASAGVQR